MSQTSFDFDAARLAAYLEQHVEGFRGPLTAEKFADGQSNPTFLISADSGPYVLRRKPPGPLLKSAHAVDREYRVMAALRDTDVPVARVFHLCADDSVIGSMFFLMEYVEGRVLWDPALPELTPAERAAIYEQMNRVLAALHRVNVGQVGLSDFGKPGNYFARQVSRWSKQYKASATEALAEMDHLIDWLPANMPPDDGRVALVHGDYRLDNMLFQRSGTEVLAVVDWELSTLGHPFADLAYQCMQLRMSHDSVISGLDGIDRAAFGIPSEAEYVAAYCERSGIDAIPDWDFYLAFSFFRLAAILQGIKKRAMDGTASSARATSYGELVKPLAEKAAAIASASA